MIVQPMKTAYRSARALYRRLRKRSVFEKIYRENLWGDAESRSGSGSGLAATEKVRRGLLDAIQRLDVHSILDAPCGDYYWLSTVDLSRHLSSYRGIDIVPQVIEQNNRRFGTDKISFEAIDLIKRVLPPADLILCRHLLIHLPLEDCVRVLRNFKASGSRYLMITNQPDIERNEEILFTGAYRPVNLYLAPFNFPRPLWSVDDAQGEGDRAEAAIFELGEINFLKTTV
jgi:hypothetical protein